jgi:hypothetical protein
MKAERLDFSLILAVSAIVVGSYFILNVEPRVLGLWVFLDLLTSFLLYSGAAMMTIPEQNVRARERVVPAGPVSRIDEWFDVDSQVSLPFLPSIYPKNLRFVLPTVFLLLIPVFGIGGALTVEGWGFGRRAGGDITELFAQFEILQRPLVATIGILIVLAQIGRFYRCHVTTGQYKRWTTHMMLEVGIQYMLWYSLLTILFVLYAILTLVVLGFGIGPFVSDATGQMIWLTVLVLTGFLIKLAFERSRIRGERQLDTSVDSFTSNFSPTPRE